MSYTSPRPSFLEPTIYLNQFRGTMPPLPPSPLSPLRSLQGNFCGMPKIEINHDIDMISEKIASASINRESNFGFVTPKRPITKVSDPIPVEFEHSAAKERQGQKRRASDDFGLPPRVVRIRYVI